MNYLLLDLQHGEKLAADHERMNLTDIGRENLEALSRRIVGYMRTLPINERRNFIEYMKDVYPMLYYIIHASSVNREFTLPYSNKRMARTGFKKRKVKGGRRLKK